MDNHKSYLKTLESNAIKSLETLQTLEEIENWRIEYLGRKGKLSQFFQSFKDIKNENKNELGTIANDLKISLEQYYKKKINSIQSSKLKINEIFDYSLPGKPNISGSIHPTIQMMNEICNAFSSLGFNIYEGPEIESEEYAFDKLNIPSNHPARDIWDTIWVENTQ